jgi:hypothetical protein
MSAAIIAAVSVVQASAARGTYRTGYGAMPGGISISPVGNRQYHLTLSLTVADSEALNMPAFLNYISDYRQPVDEERGE